MCWMVAFFPFKTTGSEAVSKTDFRSTICFGFLFFSFMRCKRYFLNSVQEVMITKINFASVVSFTFCVFTTVHILEFMSLHDVLI